MTKKGLTLVEIIVAVGILALLAAVIAPQLTVIGAKSRDARRLSDCHAYIQVLQNYMEVNRHFPGSTGDPNGLESANCEIGDTDSSNFIRFKEELNDFTNAFFPSDPLYDDTSTNNEFYYFYDGNRNNFVEQSPTPNKSYVSIHIQKLEIKNGNINSYPATPDGTGAANEADFILVLQDPRTP